MFAALNLGHTVGHAVEAVAQIPHGDAVLAGLRAMVALSVRCAGLDPAVARMLLERIAACGPPPLPRLPRERMHAVLAHDKKAGRFVLLRAPGVLVTCVPAAVDVNAALDALE